MMNMERIIREIEKIQQRITAYQTLDIIDFELNFEIMESDAERLLAEIVYFRAKNKARDKILKIKIANQIRANKSFKPTASTDDDLSRKQ